jgi:protein SCO1/2
MSVNWQAALLLLALALVFPPAHGETAQRLAQDVGVEQRLGKQLPLDLTFQNEHGTSVPLGSYFGAHPVVLTLVYYQCPNLCSLTLTSLLHSVERLDLTAGRDFEVVAVSIDPREDSKLASEKRATYAQ